MQPLPDPLERLWGYWNALPKMGGSILPPRIAFRPDELIDLLPRISLMKRIHRHEIIIGLTGSEVDKLWDRKLTGMNIFDLTAPSMRENVARFYDAILGKSFDQIGPAAAVSNEHSVDAHGRTLDVTSMYLPLCDLAGNPNYILGCTLPAHHNWRGTVKDRFVLDHRQIKGVKFFDVGAGMPEVTFIEPIADHIPPPSAHSWWSRILPGPKPATASTSTEKHKDH